MKSRCCPFLFQMQFEFQQQLSPQRCSLQEEGEHQHLVQVSPILLLCTSTSAALALSAVFELSLFPYFVLQLQQLEEHLQKSKEELKQSKSHLQENVELVG